MTEPEQPTSTIEGSAFGGLAVGRVDAGLEPEALPDLAHDGEHLDADGDAELDVALSPLEPGHRGGFGEFGGESGGLIERTFRERILLVGVSLGGADPEQTDLLLDELELLVDTAGADVVGRVHQRRRTPDPARYIGKGKAEELKLLAEATDCDTVVFDDELSPAQQYNLERQLGRTVLDRTAVILDIFAQNAHSTEGKAQVELAQLRYLLPRLRGKGTQLSQQGAGIGTRGPGETKLEVDRRRLMRRIHALEHTLADVSRHRDTQRKSRRRSLTPHVAVVGYTNAGKSTLLNALTDAGVLAEDRLFATLDSTTRRLHLPGGAEVLLTDTVGFVQKLPHQLVQAFKSTLAVVPEADLVVHVVDAAGPDPEAQMATVRAVVAEIGGGERPELVAFNKIDLFDHPAEPDPDPAPADDEHDEYDERGDRLRALMRSEEGSLAISARTGEGLAELLERIADRLRADVTPADMLIPYDRGDVLAALHRVGDVLSETTTADGIAARVRIPAPELSRWTEFVVESASIVAPGGARPGED